MTRKKIKPRVAVLDVETDPFLHGRKPEPFAAGFYDGEIYQDFWGPDCIRALNHFLERQEQPYLIYAHNGGKFDFFYFIELGLVSNPVSIINGRVVKIGLGQHELRDSFAIIPVALAAYQKEQIDYEKFEASERIMHRKEILHYLATDCENLYELVSAFVGRFGTMLTVGSTAIKELEQLHPLRRGNERHDTLFRPYYYGGRVSVFEPGLLQGNFTIYDVNSMYPHVMRNRRHPYGQQYMTFDNPILDRLGNIEGYVNRPYFAEIEATNRSALPTRTKTGLTFDQPDGLFYACSHEIIAGLRHKLLDVHAIRRAYLPMSIISFDSFVDKFIAEKIAAKLGKDKIAELFAKFMLNSAYGKFGQNPAHYFDYYIKRYNEKIPSKEWEMHMDYGEWEIWRKPTPKPRYFDVAIAGSITSASRTVLLDAIQVALRVVYCDTDSNIAEGLPLPLSETELGAWKVEATGSILGIAGKKLYALFKDARTVARVRRMRRGPARRALIHELEALKHIKTASKGADLDPIDILDLAEGGTVTWDKAAPTFKLGQDEPAWISRNITRTA